MMGKDNMKQAGQPQDAEIQDQSANVTPMEDMTIEDIIGELSNLPELQDAADGTKHAVGLVVEKKQDGFNLVSVEYQGEEKQIDKQAYLAKTPDERATIDQKQVMSRPPKGGKQ